MHLQNLLEQISKLSLKEKQNYILNLEKITDQTWPFIKEATDDQKWRALTLTLNNTL